MVKFGCGADAVTLVRPRPSITNLMSLAVTSGGRVERQPDLVGQGDARARDALAPGPSPPGPVTCADPAGPGKAG